MYDTIAGSYDELHGSEQQRKAAIIAAHYAEGILNPDMTVLDVGCGTGIASKPFVDAGCKVTGLDLSSRLLSQAAGITAVQGTAEKLPFPDSSFDLVICVTALHNVADWKKALHEISRVSKSEICITVLKRSVLHDAIGKEINASFLADAVVEDAHDTIYFLKR